MTGGEQLSGGGSTGSHDGHGDRVEAIVDARHGTRIAAVLEREPVWARDFNDLTYEARRLFGELFGTFLLVLAGAGAAVLEAATHGQIGRAAALGPALVSADLHDLSPGGQPSVTRGVHVEVGERQAAVDLDVVVDYGYPIADETTARALRASWRPLCSARR